MENKRIVVKIGTSTLAHPSGLLNIRRVEELCRVLSDLKNAGHEIILVSSGAIGMGAGKLSLPHRPEDTPTKQAAAAVGAVTRERVQAAAATVRYAARYMLAAEEKGGNADG